MNAAATRSLRPRSMPAVCGPPNNLAARVGDHIDTTGEIWIRHERQAVGDIQDDRHSVPMRDGNVLLGRKRIPLSGKINLPSGHRGPRRESFFEVFQCFDLDHPDSRTADGMIVDAARPPRDDDFALKACRFGKLLHLFRITSGDTSERGASHGASGTRTDHGSFYLQRFGEALSGAFHQLVEVNRVI